MESSTTDYKRLEEDVGLEGGESKLGEEGVRQQVKEREEGVVGRGKGGSAAATAFCVKQPACGSSTRTVWGVRRPCDRWGIALIVIGLVLIVTGLVAVRAVEHAIAQQIDKQTIVSTDPASESYQTFQTSGANKGVRVRYATNWLNITNPEEVLRGEKPVLVEMGPYIYHERRFRHNITFSGDNGDTATFVLQKTYVWDEEANAGSGLSDVNDMVTTVHPVIQVVQRQLQDVLSKQLSGLAHDALGWVPGLETLVRQSLDRAQLWELSLKLVLCQGSPMGVSPFVTRSARDLFWGYFNDPVLLSLQSMVDDIKKLAEAVGKQINLPNVPGAFPGLMVNVTSAEDAARRVAPDTAHTGRQLRDDLMQYVRFQNMDMVYVCSDPTTGPQWNESAGEMPACYLFDPTWTPEEAAAHGYHPQWAANRTNHVKGTDGSMFQHPMRADYITTFQEDYRRYVVLDYEREHRDFRDVTLRRYVFRWRDWQNCTYVPENADYYQCNLPQGFTNVSMNGGFPLYLSKPHLIDADPAVQSRVLGLSPNNASHLTYIDVEPISGLTFDAHKRVQLNVLLQDQQFPAHSKQVVAAFLAMLGRAPTGKVAQCMTKAVDWDFNGEIYMPMVWYDEGFTQPVSVTDEFKSGVYGSKHAARTYHVVGVVLGVLAVVAAIVAMVGVRWKERRQQNNKEAAVAALDLGPEEKDEAGASRQDALA